MTFTVIGPRRNLSDVFQPPRERPDHGLPGHRARLRRLELHPEPNELVRNDDHKPDQLFVVSSGGDGTDVNVDATDVNVDDLSQQLVDPCSRHQKVLDENV